MNVDAYVTITQGEPAIMGSIIFTNRLVSTKFTVHGFHCTPTSTPATFKETARSETSLAEPLTSGGRVVGSVANPPFGGGGGGGPIPQREPAIMAATPVKGLNKALLCIE